MIKPFEITPNRGAGPLRFGMTVQQIRTAMEITETPVKTLRLSKFEEHPVDYYPALGLVIHYDHGGKCNALEFSGPAAAIFKQAILLSMTAAKVEQWLSKLDPDAALDPPDLTSEAFGLAFYLEEGHVQSVLVFQKGYFNE